MQERGVPKAWRSVSKRLSFAAPHIHGFTIWLREDGYSEATIKELIRLLAAWTCPPQKLESTRPELVARLWAGCGIIAA